MTSFCMRWQTTNYTRNNTCIICRLVTPGSLHVNCQETKHEIIPTYSVNHITPGGLHVKCQETTHEIIPAYSLDHSTSGSLHVKVKKLQTR